MFSKTLVQRLHWECPYFPSLAKFPFIIQDSVLTSLEILPSQVLFLVQLKLVVSLSSCWFCTNLWYNTHLTLSQFLFVEFNTRLWMPWGHYILSLSYFPVVVGIFASDNNTHFFSLGNDSFSMCFVLTITVFLFPGWQDVRSNHCTLMLRP